MTVVPSNMSRMIIVNDATGASVASFVITSFPKPCPFFRSTWWFWFEAPGSLLSMLFAHYSRDASHSCTDHLGRTDHPIAFVVRCAELAPWADLGGFTRAAPLYVPGSSLLGNAPACCSRWPSALS